MAADTGGLLRIVETLGSAEVMLPLIRVTGIVIVIIGLWIFYSTIMKVIDAVEERGQRSGGSLAASAAIAIVLFTMGSQMAMESSIYFEQTGVVGIGWDTLYASRSVEMPNIQVSGQIVDKKLVAAWMAIVGFIGVLGIIRGLLMLQDHQNGGRSSVGAAIFFIFAGLAASNFSQMLKLVDGTLKLNFIT